MKERRTKLPGDPSDREYLERAVRVDHAGEYGATRIYAGQLAVLGDSASGDTIRHMAEQEQRHLDTFNRILSDRRVRPTALLPLWHIAGFALGAGTALLGEKAAMACTVAVEDVIEEHYRDQMDALGDGEGELKATISQFRDEELEHRKTGLEQGAEQAPITAAVKAGSRLAIWLSERI